MWKLDQCSNAGLKKAPCSAQMVIIWPKEAAWLTQLIHKAAFAVITLPWLWFLTSTGSPPGSTPPCLGMFVTERGNPGDVFYSAGSQITTTGQGAAAQGRPRSDYKGWEGFVDGENTNKTTSGRCCSPQDRLATQGSSAKSYSGSREATRAPRPPTSHHLCRSHQGTGQQDHTFSLQSLAGKAHQDHGWSWFIPWGCPYTSRAGCTKWWWLPDPSSFTSQKMLPEVVTVAAQSHVPE